MIKNFYFWNILWKEIYFKSRLYNHLMSIRLSVSLSVSIKSMFHQQQLINRSTSNLQYKILITKSHLFIHLVLFLFQSSWKADFFSILLLFHAQQPTSSWSSAPLCWIGPSNLKMQSKTRNKTSRHTTNETQIR